MLPFRAATSDDLGRLGPLLAAYHLSPEGLLEPGTRLWLIEEPPEGIIAIGGLEYGADAVLLRSVLVHQTRRGQGLGALLVEQLLASAAQAGYADAYLFSTGAGPYWQRLGFVEVPVDELVGRLPDAPQVRDFARKGWLPTEVAWRRALRSTLGTR